VLATPPEGGKLDRDALLAKCRQNMPQYMVPLQIVERAALPRNPNGKIDRKLLSGEMAEAFQQETA
jgi:acyl-CoA synthetase (AMP-forming)/AMP-acid ligase II